MPNEKFSEIKQNLTNKLEKAEEKISFLELSFQESLLNNCFLLDWLESNDQEHLMIYACALQFVEENSSMINSMIRKYRESNLPGHVNVISVLTKFVEEKEEENESAN